MYEESSVSGIVTVASPREELSQSLAEMIGQLQDSFQTTFGLRPKAKSRLQVRIENWDYRGPASPPLLTAWTNGTSLHLQIRVQQSPALQGEELLRPVVMATFYQSLYEEEIRKQIGESLLVLPLWLVEGELQSVLEGQPELNQRIVARAFLLRKTPDLSQIMGWRTLSNERLERLWQQAFCYQLLQFILADPNRWAVCKNGLLAATQKAPITPPPWELSPQWQADWVAFQDGTRSGQGALRFSAERSAAELTAAQSILLPAVNKSEALLLRLDELADHRDHPAFAVTVTNKLSELLVLQMRAHFSWQPVIQSYRSALHSLQIASTTKAIYLSRVAAAQQQASQLTDYSKRVDDYLNWFEVTKHMNEEGSIFEDYFQLNEELEGFFNQVRAAPEAEMVRIERRM